MDLGSKTADELLDLAKGYLNERNYKMSVECFEAILAISPDDARTMTAPVLATLAVIYFHGLGVTKDYNVAYNYVCRTLDIDQDDLSALNILSEMYANGYCVEKNIDKALEIGKRVCESAQPLPESLVIVGTILNEIEKNHEEALIYLSNPCCIEANYTISLKNCLSTIISTDYVEPLKPKTIEILTNLDLNKIYSGKIPSILSSFVASVKHHVDLLDLHLKYSVEGKGFEEAKSDFYSKITDYDSE